MSGLQMAGVTDPGRRRSRNEDDIAFDADGGFAILADGMGGHNAGDVASRLVVETLTASLRAEVGEAPARLKRALVEANRRVHSQAQAAVEHTGMGATVVAALFTPRRLLVAHVGDARLYRWRAGRLQPLTADHSLVQELVASGMLTPEDARRSPHRNVVTRAIGIGPQVAVEVSSHPRRRGDRLLLCSDGLTDLVDEAAIAAILAAGRPPEATALDLVALANERGGTDNVSVIIADDL
jgi:protein phosphatase